MCGRITQKSNPKVLGLRIATLVEPLYAADVAPRYNGAPGQQPDFGLQGRHVRRAAAPEALHAGAGAGQVARLLQEAGQAEVAGRQLRVAFLQLLIGLPGLVGPGQPLQGVGLSQLAFRSAGLGLLQGDGVVQTRLPVRDRPRRLQSQ